MRLFEKSSCFSLEVIHLLRKSIHKTSEHPVCGQSNSHINLSKAAPDSLMFLAESHPERRRPLLHAHPARPRRRPAPQGARCPSDRGAAMNYFGSPVGSPSHSDQLNPGRASVLASRFQSLEKRGLSCFSEWKKLCPWSSILGTVDT